MIETASVRVHARSRAVPACNPCGWHPSRHKRPVLLEIDRQMCSIWSSQGSRALNVGGVRSLYAENSTAPSTSSCSGRCGTPRFRSTVSSKRRVSATHEPSLPALGSNHKPTMQRCRAKYPPYPIPFLYTYITLQHATRNKHS